MKASLIKFPYDISKGSCHQRWRKAGVLTENLMEKLYDLYKNTDAVGINELEKRAKGVFPQKINFVLKKVPNEKSNDFWGETVVVYKNATIEPDRYKVCIPANKNKLHKKDLSTLAHEFAHLFEYLMMPKTLKTTKRLYSDEVDLIADEIYNRYIYTENVILGKKLNELIVKNRLENSLKQFTSIQKIHILTYMKESLESEMFAYKTQQKCQDKLFPKTKQREAVSYAETEKNYNFSGKLKIVKSLLYKYISKERRQTASELASSHIDKLK